jgi:hypothetical protein
MTKVVVTAQVVDAREWESAFRAHVDLFRTQAIKSPMSFAVTGDNEIAIYSETDDLDTFTKVLESQATVDAMRNDGVKRETVKVFVLDKELAL